MLDQSFYQKADEIIAFYGKKPASLIPIMQDIQGVYRYLPEELLTYVAEQIGVTEAKAFSVATFYENFSFDAKGKYVIASRSGNGDRRTYAVHPLRHPRDRHQRTRRCDLTTGRQRGCEEMNPHFFTALFCAFLSYKAVGLNHLRKVSTI